MEHPIRQGRLDVSNRAHEIVPLAGDWECLEDTTGGEEAPPRSSFAQLPSLWRHPFGFASYRLRLTGLDPRKNYALRLSFLETSYRVSVDGKVVFQAGIPERTKEAYRAAYGSGVVSLSPEVREVEIVVEVANFLFSIGGPFKTIFLGEESAIRKSEAWSVFFDGATAGLCLVMACVCFLNAIARVRRDSLFFGLIFLAGGGTIFLTSVESLPFRLFPSLDWVLYIKLAYIFTYLIPVFVLFSVHSLFGGLSERTMGLLASPVAAILALVVFAPPQVFTRMNSCLQGYSLFLLVIALSICWGGVRRRYPYARGFTFGFLILAGIMLNAFFFADGKLAGGQFLLLSFLASTLRLSFLSRHILAIVSYLCLVVCVNIFSLVFILDNNKRVDSSARMVAGGETEAIRGMCASDGLSPREIEVTLLVLRGMGNRRIGEELCISLSTVKTHLAHIFQKTGTHTRNELFFHFHG